MADRPNVNPTPKEEFQNNASFVKMHRELMQQPMLAVSLQFAVLEYQRHLARPTVIEGNTAASNFYRLCGVNEFLDTLKKLAEMPDVLKSVPSPTKIDHSK